MNNNPNPSPRPSKAYFDVVRPGRTPASPTSRPVINNSRPPVQDTTFKAPATQQQTLLNPKQKITIQPSTPTTPAAKVNTAMPAPVSVDRPASQSTMQQRLSTPKADMGKPAVEHEVVQEVDADDGHYLPEQHAGGRSVLSEVLAILAIVFLIAVIVDILLDAEIINLPLPHTNFFDY
jgi:hypothetical protein